MSANPLHQFEIHKIADLHVAGFDISVTNHTVWVMLAAASVSFLLLLGSRGLKTIPGRGQGLMEMTISFIRELTRETAGEKGLKFLPFIAALFMFVAGVNLFGMIPGSYTGTSQMFTTGTLAVTVITTVIITGFYHQGFKFLGIFYPSGTPWWLAPLVVLLELISFFARPFTLSLRLGANMMAGHILLKVFATFVIMILAVVPALSVVPLALVVALTGLEIGVALLQAYIFTILTCVYLHDALYGH